MNHSDGEKPRRRLYRDSERGVILGVCAGVAERFGLPPWLVRVGALALVWFHPVPVILAYVIAAVLMRERPLRYHGEGDERSFWQSCRHRS